MPKSKQEQTSKKVARKAAKILRSPEAGKSEKSVAGSALTQTRDKSRKSKRS